MKVTHIAYLRAKVQVSCREIECVALTPANDNKRERICPDCGWSGWPCLCEGDMA